MSGADGIEFLDVSSIFLLAMEKTSIIVLLRPRENTMAIQPGSYRTTGGRRAVVLCNDAPGMWPVIGYVINSEEGISHPRGWMETGRSYNSIEHSDDLMIVKKAPTITIIEHDFSEPTDDEVAEARSRWNQVCDQMARGCWSGSEADALAEIARCKAIIYGGAPA